MPRVVRHRAARCHRAVRAVQLGQAGGGVPAIHVAGQAAEDIKTLMETVGEFVDRGGKISQSQMRDRLGFDDPGDGEELLAAKKSAAAGAPLATESTDDERGAETPRERAGRLAAAIAAAAASSRPSAFNGPSKSTLAGKPRARVRCPSCGGAHGLAAHRFLAAFAGIEEDDIDQLIAAEAGDWEAVIDPLVAPLVKAAEGASSFEEIEAMLPDLARDVDGSALSERLARLAAIARGLGDASD